MIGNPLLGPLFGGRAAARWGANNQLRLPREGLLLYLGRPNATGADAGKYILPDATGADAPAVSIRSATGWVSGTANLFYDAAGASVAVSSVDILGWSGINQYHILFSARGWAIYDPYTVSLAILAKAARWMNGEYDSDVIARCTPFEDSIGLHDGPPQPGRGYLGDGVAYVTVTGLLTTDTIAAESTDLPTCTVNGRLDIASGKKIWGVTIKRAGVTVAYYPCAESVGNIMFNMFPSLANALPNGLISATTIHTAIFDGTGFDLNQNGWQNLVEPNYTYKLPSTKKFVTRPGDGATVGAETLSNPNFISWASASQPNGWTSFGQNASHYLVRCDADGNAATAGEHLRIVSNDGGSMGVFAGSKLVPGAWNQIEINCVKKTIGSLQLIIGDNPGSQVIIGVPLGTTIYTVYVPANIGAKTFYINRYSGQTDVVIKKASLKVGLPTLLDNDVDNDIKITCWGDSITYYEYPLYLSTMVGRIVNNRGIGGGQTSTQIKTRMLAETDRHNDITIICAGTNNNLQQATILADIAEMVAALSHSNYMVISIFGNNLATAGSGAYNRIEAINAELSSAYGEKYLDVRRVLINSYDPLIPQDVTDFANDITPSSLRRDEIHPNFDGFLIMALAIKAKLVDLGYAYDPGTLGQFNLPGRTKYNLTPISNPSGTTIIGDYTYSLANADQVRKAVAWEYGVDHWAFTDAGVPKAITGATLKANGIGLGIWANDNQITIVA